MNLWRYLCRLKTFFNCHLPVIMSSGTLFCLTILSFHFFLNNAYATYPPSFSDCLTGDGEEYDQVDACRQLLRSNSKNYKLHVALSKTLDKRQKHKQSIKAYNNALQIFPGDNYFLKKRAIAESNLKEQRWLLNKNQSKQAGMNKSAVSKTSSAFKLNKIRCTRLSGQVALEACRQAIKENAEDASLFISLGNIYASQQKNNQAVMAYKKAVKLKPKDHKTSEKLNKLLYRQKIAKKNLEKSKKLTQIKAKSKPVKKQQVLTKSQAPVKTKILIKSKTLANKKVPKKTKSRVTKTNVLIVSQDESESTKNSKQTNLKPEQQQFLEQLNLLRSLKDQQIISQEDYEQRKKALLDSTFRVVPLSNNNDLAKGTQKNALKKVEANYKGLNFGNYHALIIGNNQYKHLPKLETAVNDAQVLADLLKRHYGFKVNLLLNANRYDTLKAMSEYRNTLTKEDNLLIYYAGHGILDKASERGYWLPTDAELNFTSNWLSTADVTDTLKALQSWHVLVVADSCYSGTLVRSIPVKFKTPEKKYSLIQRLLKKKSRTVITSGGLEPVVDSGGDNHSVFSSALLDVLRNTDDVIEAEEVFSRLRDNVILNADQTPEYSNVRKVGHNGGDFIFRRQ